MASVVIVGLGYVGLPLAKQAVGRGHAVVGLDSSEAVVDSLNRGLSHIDDLGAPDIESMRVAGFEATTDPRCVESADVVIICVPTPLSPAGGPDLTAVEAAGRAVGDHLQPGSLVVLESTTYPGTTEELLLPLLEQGSGLHAGREFALAFSPERVDPGNTRHTIQNTPKVVGGFTPACSHRAVEFYGTLVDTVVAACGTREAEMAKLLENTYRHVNIALVNEMARFSHELGVDIWDAIRLASTKPFGFQAFYPGPGVGGHCIPIDPNYLSHRVREKLGYPFRFVELAQEINAAMPGYVVQRIQELLNADRLAVNGSTILLLGITYKPNISDQRETPARPIANQLLRRGATVVYADPLVDEWDLPGVECGSGDPCAAAAAADVTVLLQPHQSFDLEGLVASSRRFLDLRGAASGDQVHRL